MKHVSIIIIIVIVIALGLLVYFMFSGSPTSPSPKISASETPLASFSESPGPSFLPSETPLTTPSLQTQSVSISNFAFNPGSITIPVGATIIWTNNDSVPHTVSSDTNIFTSGTLNPGQTFRFTFNNKGTFSYHCSIHISMTARVVVQ